MPVIADATYYLSSPENDIFIQFGKDTNEELTFVDGNDHLDKALVEQMFL